MTGEPPARYWALWVSVALLLLLATVATLFTTSPQASSASATKAETANLNAEFTVVASRWRAGKAVSHRRLKRTSRVVANRLRAAKIPRDVSVWGKKGLKVKIPRNHLEQAKRLVLQRGQLRFYVLVSDQLPKGGVATKIAEVLNAKRTGTWAENDRFNAFPTSTVAPDPSGNAHGLVFNASASRKKEAEWIGNEDFSKQYATRDSQGKPALGVELNRDGRSRIFLFTSPQIGNKLACVRDGKIVATVPIVGPVRNRLTVSVADWSKADVQELVFALTGGELPLRLRQQPDTP